MERRLLNLLNTGGHLQKDCISSKRILFTRKVYYAKIRDILRNKRKGSAFKMEALALEAKIRENKGKGYAKKIRREGLLPSVLYGPEVETLPLQVQTRELEKIINKAGERALIKLKVDGKEYMTLIREIQRSPVKGEILHADFYQVSLKEELETQVPIVFVGESPGIKEGGVLQHLLRELDIKCLPTKIPEHIEVDISGLGIGDSVTVGDLKVSEDIEILNDPDTVIASVVAVSAAEVEEEAEDAEGEAEGEKEGAEKEAPEEE